MAIPIVNSPAVGTSVPQENFNLPQFVKGKQGYFQQVPLYSPAQSQAMGQLLNYALPQVTASDNKFDFAPIASNVRREFYENTLPSVLEQFREGGRLSSGYRNTLAGATANLESQLGALQSGYNLQRQSQIQGLLGLGLAPQFSTQHIAAEPGTAQQVAPYVGQAIGESIPKVVGAGVDLLKGGAQAIGNKLFGGNNPTPAQLQQLALQAQPTAGVQALKAAGQGLATGAAGAGASQAANVLGPVAAKAIGGLSTFGSWFVPIAAGLALTAAGYVAYKAYKGWQKKRDLNAAEQKLAAQLNQQYGDQNAQTNPTIEQRVAQGSPAVQCQGGVCSFNKQPLFSGTLNQQIAAGLRPASDAFPQNR